MNVYLDNAATTPIAEEVLQAMIPALRDEFGNPSSTHQFGRKAKGAVEGARKSIAERIQARPSSIVFTSGGTEADNMAIHTAITSLQVKTIISSPIEHHAVLRTVEDVRDHREIEVKMVELDQQGNVDLEHLKTLLEASDQSTLVSLMHANNEIGTLLPLDTVSKICREHGAYFHSDTVQTMGHYPFNLRELDIDFITCSAHKLHGPKGVGFLYVNPEIPSVPFIRGGAQERGLRGGTENLYGIVGLNKALEIAYDGMEAHQSHIQELKSYMIEQLRAKFSDIAFHGEITPEKSLYTVLNVSFPPSEQGSMLLFSLDLKGIACSGGSACSSGSNQGSHVLSGINANPERPNARFSFSRYTTKAEIDYTLEVLKEACGG